MNAKTIIVAILALFCGGSAAILVVLLNMRAPNPAQDKVETVQVVMSTTEIGRGISIDSHMVALRDWPKASVPEGACVSLDEVLGQSSRFGVVRDEVLIKTRLTAGSGLNALITPGMRAYTIQTSTVSSGVGGFLQPDDRVDVILTVTSASKGDEKTTGGGIATILLQNVQVLAAGRSLQANTDDGKIEGRATNSVTLLVTARQAQELTLAQTKGTLNLALRREGDAAGETSEPLYLSDLPFMRDLPNSDESADPFPAAPEQDIAPSPVVPPRVISFIRVSRGVSQELLPILDPQRRSDLPTQSEAKH